MSEEEAVNEENEKSNGMINIEAEDREENKEENKDDNSIENIVNQENQELNQIQNQIENQEENESKENAQNENENINLDEQVQNNEEIKENINLEDEKNEEKEIKLINNNELDKLIKINQHTEKEDFSLNKDLLNLKQKNSGNIIRSNDISFSKQGFFEENNEINNNFNHNNNINKNININNNYNNNFNNNSNYHNYNLNNNYIQKKTTKQLLNEINNDMDILERDLKPIFKNFEIKQRIQQNNNSSNYSFNDNDENNSYNESDEQNNEIKELIQRANYLLNNQHRFKKNYLKNKKKNINEYYRVNGGIFNYNMKDNDINIMKEKEKGYIKNISLDKNINKNRIKKMDYIHENTDSCINEPMIYYQKEAFPIKNSYMNKSLGFPQTSKKIEYLKAKNNLIYSSDKIPFKRIKYDNINQSIDLFFSEQK